MSNCSITFLFDSGQVFAETWNLSASHGDDPMARLHRIANARLSLLAADVRIVLLKAKGHKPEGVDLPGTGGSFAWTRDGLNLMRISDGMSASNLCLRGIPHGFFVNLRLTPAGATAVEYLGKTLVQCRVVVIRGGERRPITDLQITGKTLLSYKKNKAATRRKLISILGEEKALLFWEEMKKRKRTPG